MEEYSSSESSAPDLPSSVVIKPQSAISAASSCSSTMYSSSSNSVSSMNEMAIESEATEKHDAITLIDDRSQSSDNSSQSSESMAKLSLMLDDVREMARMGHNATLKCKCRLPSDILKSDIHVIVDIDERARAKNPSRSQLRLEQKIQDAIRDDLRTVYSATAASATLILCIVVVVMADGSLTRAFWDFDGVVGLAEVGLVWRLFEADDLRVYEGGLIVQSEDLGYSVSDLFRNNGQRCLLEKLVPRIANDVMTRIGDSNYELLVEI